MSTSTMHDNNIVEIYNEDFYAIPDSFRLLVFIVDRCNYNCEYCYNHFPRTQKCLDLSKVYEFIYKIIFGKMKKKFLHLDLIGGETLLHPQLIDFCKKISNDKSIFTTVYSNFSLPIDKYKQLLASNVHLLLSWHYCADPDRYKEKFSMLSKDEIEKQITLSIMYEHRTWKLGLEMFDYFSRVYPSMKELEFSILDENENYNGKKYTQQQLDEFNRRAPKTKTPTTKLVYADGAYEYANDNFFFKDVQNTNFKYWLCNAGIDFLFIYFDGIVHICDENDGIDLFNIEKASDISRFMPPKKALFCKREHCPCLFDLYKKKIFK